MISYDDVALRFLFRVEAGRRFKFQRWWCVGVERHLTATGTECVLIVDGDGLSDVVVS